MVPSCGDEIVIVRVHLMNQQQHQVTGQPTCAKTLLCCRTCTVVSVSTLPSLSLLTRTLGACSHVIFFHSFINFFGLPLHVTIFHVLT